MTHFNLDFLSQAWGRVPAGCLIPSSEDLGKCVQFISSGETTAKQVQLIHPDVIKEITKPQMLLDDWSMSRFSLNNYYPVIASGTWYGSGLVWRKL